MCMEKLAVLYLGVGAIALGTGIIVALWPIIIVLLPIIGPYAIVTIVKALKDGEKDVGKIALETGVEASVVETLKVALEKLKDIIS